ncbi:hypothetical protein B0H19DRAFT_1068929 [Mycena capillaripes]|nr:hypothetical protein B0H19DRAFT_1068929 [Mycena capillaripes]
MDTIDLFKCWAQDLVYVGISGATAKTARTAASTKVTSRISTAAAPAATSTPSSAIDVDNDWDSAERVWGRLEPARNVGLLAQVDMVINGLADLAREHYILSGVGILADHGMSEVGNECNNNSAERETKREERRCGRRVRNLGHFENEGIVLEEARPVNRPLREDD